jgi:ureidoacrylate peracid hydrolase
MEIAARPTAVLMRPESTAVVVVDMQNDFVSEGGMFDRAGIDVRGAQAIIGSVSNVLDAARAAGVVVVYLKMAFRPDLCDAVPDSPIWIKHVPLKVGAEVTAPDGSTSRILIRDTWNTEIVDELRPHDGDVVIYKSRYSGFYDTELDAELGARGVRSLIVVGTTTSVCVESTIRDACFRDYHCLVVEDGTAEPIAADAPRTNHEATLAVMERLFAWVTDSGAVIDALEGARR